jgi:SAM-dependent methyltransferase
MTQLAEILRDRYFASADHPYKVLEAAVTARLQPDSTLLDAGCGGTAPMLEKYLGRAGRLIGVDSVPFENMTAGLELIQADLAQISLPDGCVDVVMSRSVMEHLADPSSVFAEVHRLLRPGGWFIFLTPNLWDYASLASLVIPDGLHARIVSRTEGRAEKDVFPTHYRANTKRTIRGLSARTGFELRSLDYLGQYPNYFMFNGALFALAAVYEKLLTYTPPLHFLRGWILAVARKADTER